MCSEVRQFIGLYLTKHVHTPCADVIFFRGGRFAS